MQMPPLWTGVAGQGNQKIYSLGGKWYPVGTTLQSGYTIVGDDGKGTLKMTWNGLPVSVPMQGSSIQPYTPPPAMPMAPAWMGGGALSTSEEALKDYLYDFEGNQRTAEDMQKLFMIDQMKRKQLYLKYPNSIPQEEMYQ